MPGMPGSGLPGIPVSMQQRLDLSSVTLAQSLGLRQHEHLMTLAGAGSSAAAAAVAASAAGGLSGPPGAPHPNPEKIGMTNVSFHFFFSLFKLNLRITLVLSLLFQICLLGNSRKFDLV